jgi:DNA processing protein
MNKSWFIKIWDTTYPQLLKEIYNPPEELFYKGKVEFLNKTCIAIVGTRRNTDYGEFITEKIIEELSVLDIAIVSGLAKGIDTVAHKSALKNNLPTIAVLGSGINNIYPRSNNNLAAEIEQNGLIISEYEDQTAPVDFQFPQRNRIISGLSIAVIVIEAPEKSGSLITAKLALDQNREIFTVPGDIDRETSIGPLKLIQNCGAYPVSSGKDVIEVLQKQPSLFKKKITGRIVAKTCVNSCCKPKINEVNLPLNLTIDQQKIFTAIPKHKIESLERIHLKTNLSPANILCNLSILEIQGLIKSENGGYSKT